VSAPRPFLFGKLPAHGDFVARGLDATARDAWDLRASAVLQTARERLGDDFEALHDCAPPWRFVCGPSSLGEGWRAGALAPSVDGAGRRFFIVLGVDALSAEAAHAAGERAAEGSEAAIYEALSSGADADAALNSAQALAAGLETGGEGPPSGPGRWWTVDETGAVAQTIAAAEPPADLLLRNLETMTMVEAAR
jgi:type VI secretion system protein ImpM